MPDLARSYAALGRLRAQQGRRDEARAAIMQAVTIFEDRGVLGEPERLKEELTRLC
jgi:hypothetical protein